MITFSSLGAKAQLGNQLFQYAFLRSMAHKLDIQFYCPIFDGDKMFELNDEKERSATSGETVHSYCQPKDNCGYTASAFKICDGTDINGYFQSEMYFERSDVLKWYIFRPEIKSVQEKYSNIDFSNSISLSLRLGDDYESFRDRYPLYKLDYYKKALRRLGYTNEHILIFSDKPEAAQDFCRSLINDRTLIMEGNSRFEDLFLISRCRHNIITNSTFSWWGAYLNSHKDKKVIIPKHWFRPGQGVINPDIAPDGWEKLSGINPILNHYLIWLFRERLSGKVNKLFVGFGNRK